MRSPFSPYKNADLYFSRTTDAQYSEIVTDNYGNPVDISDRSKDSIHIEAYLVAMPSWKTSEGKLFHAADKGSGERVRGGSFENYLAFYGYVISPLDLPPELGTSILNGTAKIQSRGNLINEGFFKLLNVYQAPAVIPYKVSKIITRINGVFSWQ